MQLSTQQWLNDICVTQRVFDGVKRYFPRNQKTLKRLYAIDSTSCGFYEYNLPKKAIILNTEDEIIQ